jgi:hypothetical protein
MPPELQATFQSAVERPGQEPRIGSSFVACPGDETGRFECELPADVLDLKLRVRGSASRFLWGLRVASDEALDLGDLVLVPGASVVGWARPEGGRAEDLTVQVEPAGQHGRALDGQDVRVKLRTFEGAPDGRGFFHVVGLPAGTYRIVVSCPGFATARTGVFVVGEGIEATWPETIELRRPVVLELALVPPVDPSGRPWQVGLVSSSEGGSMSVLARAEVDPATGEVRLEQVPAGLHTLNVRDRRRALWSSEQVLVASDSGPLLIEIPTITVLGQVLLGDAPLQAAVRLDNPEGKCGNLWFRSNEDGVFTGSLPFAATWWVLLRLADGSEVVPRLHLHLSDAEPGETAEVEIRLDDTEIEGSVVDAAGEPVADAHILAIPDVGAETLLATFDAYSVADGSFRLIALPPGRAWVSASRGGAASAKVELELVEGRPIRDLRLVLRENHVVTGRVVSDLGPVAGAAVALSPDPVGQTWSVVVQGITSIDGQFSLEVPAEHVTGDLFVNALGYAAGIRKLDLQATEPVSVHLTQIGGTLVVRWSKDRPGASSPSMSPVLTYGGTAEPLLGYWDWIRANPGGQWSWDSPLASAVIPQMPPGAYSACLAARPRADDDTSTRSPGTECVDGVLAPGGELVLTLE